MAVKEEVKNYLDKAGVSYQAVSHPQTFSSTEEARAVGVRTQEVAKTLVVYIKGNQALVVLPGSTRMDSHKLRQAMGHSHARLALEEEMARDFPKYEVGAVPPLGALFGIPVYVDRCLLEDEEIVFTGGTHTDSVKMKLQDFLDLVKPELIDVCSEI